MAVTVVFIFVILPPSSHTPTSQLTAFIFGFAFIAVSIPPLIVLRLFYLSQSPDFYIHLAHQCLFSLSVYISSFNWVSCKIVSVALSCCSNLNLTLNLC